MEEVSVEKRNWSDLPGHLLDIIMDKLFPPLMFMITRPPTPPPPNPLPLPLPINNKKKKTRLLRRRLYVPPPPPPINNEKKIRLSRFYNISDENIDGTLEEVRIPSYRHCRGSSHGWLITVDDTNYTVRLINPFLSTNTNGFEILLPSLMSLPITSENDRRNLSFLRKAVLSANPLTNPTDFTVMGIYGPFGSLAFFKPGNKHWTSIESPKIEPSSYFTDVIYCHRYAKFFVVNWNDAVVAVLDEDNVNVGGGGGGGGMIAKLVIQPPLSFQNSTRKYLIVESSGRGELLKVYRFIIQKGSQAMYREDTIATTGFRVFRLKVTGGAKEEEYYEWQEVKSLCGDSIILGHYNSIYIRASDYPGCKPNSIHYTDDDEYGLHLDTGIFNLEDGSFKSHLPIAPKNTSATIWIQPSLQPNKNRRSSS